MLKFTLVLLGSLVIYATIPNELCIGFAPENNFVFSEDSLERSSITQEDTNQIISDLSELYTPTFTGMNRKLIFNFQWHNDQFNAYTNVSRGRAMITITGGMVRHPLISRDGVALVLCHEIGHHLGGKPKHKSFGFDIFASTEGQADYFSTLKCMRKYYLSKDSLPAINYDLLPDSVIDNCSDRFIERNDQEVCLRSNIASITMSKVLNSLRKVPMADLSIEIKDPTIVKKTFRMHPNPQCRLDTYSSGTLCEVSHDDNIDISKEVSAQCNRVSGHRLDTVRPLCWYRPKK